MHAISVIFRCIRCSLLSRHTPDFLSQPITVKIIWDLIMALMIAYSVVVVPLRIGSVCSCAVVEVMPVPKCNQTWRNLLVGSIRCVVLAGIRVVLVLLRLY